MRDIAEILNELPKECAARKPGSSEPILLKRGQKGYWPFPAIKSEEQLQEFNDRRNVTGAQLEAMICGSVFGFDCPAADPANYDENGNWRKECTA